MSWWLGCTDTAMKIVAYLSCIYCIWYVLCCVLYGVREVFAATESFPLFVSTGHIADVLAGRHA